MKAELTINPPTFTLTVILTEHQRERLAAALSAANKREFDVIYSAVKLADRGGVS